MAEGQDATPNREEEQQKCEFEGCEEPTTVKGSAGSFCDSDHLLAAANDWDPSELSEYAVEHNGVEGTFRAPDRETADRQWRSKVIARGLDQ